MLLQHERARKGVHNYFSQRGANFRRRDDHISTAHRADKPWVCGVLPPTPHPTCAASPACQRRAQWRFLGGDARRPPRPVGAPAAGCTLTRVRGEWPVDRGRACWSPGTAGGPAVRRTHHHFRPRRCGGQHKCVSSQARHVARLFAQPSTPTCSNRCGCNQAIRAGEIEYLVNGWRSTTCSVGALSPACQEIWPNTCLCQHLPRGCRWRDRERRPLRCEPRDLNLAYGLVRAFLYRVSRSIYL